MLAVIMGIPSKFFWKNQIGTLKKYLDSNRIRNNSIKFIKSTQIWLHKAVLFFFKNAFGIVRKPFI